MENMELNATVDETKKESGVLNEEELKQKYEKLYEVTVTVDENDENEGRRISFLFTQPSAASFNRYVKTVSKNIVSATNAFVRDNIIKEQVKELDEESAKYPALTMNMGQKLLSVLGFSDNVNFRQL